MNRFSPQFKCCLAAILLLMAWIACPAFAQGDDAPSVQPPAKEFADFPDGRPSEEGGPPPPPRPFPPHAPHEHPQNDRIPPQVRHYFTQLRKENPAEYERLLKLRMEDRDQFMREMAKRLPHRRNETDEQFRKLDQQCEEIADKLRAVPPPENAAELQKQLEGLVAESVDSMIAQTKRRVEEVQARLQQMERLRDRIVQQRLDFYLKVPKEPQKFPPEAMEAADSLQEGADPESK